MMRFLPMAASAGMFALLSLSNNLPAAPNADIFPPEPAAQQAIHWDNGYFVINGTPTFVTSGDMPYARIPRALWKDRLWRAKQMGFNCIQTYVFWNATEGKEGLWDFSDNLDLDAWLTTIQEMGMYAIVRVGPYSCAEWDHGGFPAWLTIKPGMTLRDNDPTFLQYADPHLAVVEKIVAKHQVNHGGNVILVQIENEHPRGWGTDENDPYLKHLYDQARANGLEVPLFLSGLHHGSDPSGETPYPVGASPWFTTEFWTGWIGKWGDMDPGMLNEKVRGTWKIIAFGGAGYDYYVVHGGTNFGYSGDTFEATYDYSAPIGESGEFHNLYYPARRAALFAQSFSSLLTGSHDDPAFAKSDLPGLRVTTRTNPTGGSIVFVDNFQKKVAAANLPETAPDAAAYQAPGVDAQGVLSTRIHAGGITIPQSGSLKVAPEEPRTVLVNIPWTRDTSLAYLSSNVLLRQTIGDIDYWVCYGTPGDTGEIALKMGPQMTPTADFTYPADGSVKEQHFNFGDGHKAVFLVMSTDTTKTTWFVNGKLIIGPSFVQQNGALEFPPEGGTATIYSAAGKSTVTSPAATTPDLPVLADWTWRDAAPERAPGFDTKGWGTSTGPQAMEAYDGFENRYGWYRTTFHEADAATLSLHFAAESGTFAAFLNGQRATLDHLNATAGDNTLAIMAKIGPRPKLYNFTGFIGLDAARGLRGGVSTEPAIVMAASWKQWTGLGDPGTPEAVSGAGYDDSAWKQMTASARLNRGTAWFRGTFSVGANQTGSSLAITGFRPDSEHAWLAVYLNGRRLRSASQNVAGLLTVGTNTVLVQERVTDARGASVKPGLNLWLNSALTDTAWYFHGGLNGLDETPIIGRVTDWSQFLALTPWQAGDTATPGLPTFWKCTFSYHHPAGMTESIGIITTGLIAGHIWLNGHNLGESPQNVPMYMPECWLKDGNNDLVVFDLYGAKPDQVHLQRYEVHQMAQR